MLKRSRNFAGFLLLTGLLSAPQAAIARTEPAQNTTVIPNQNIILEKPIFEQPAVEKPLRLEISRSQRRVTLYRGTNVIKSYPVAVGKPGWETPLGSYRVAQMVKDPIWVHPFTGEKVPGADPENPLGRHWIGFWTNGRNWIGFHGTPNPSSVGRAASHGCVRMYNKDVEELFKQVVLGTEVRVIQ